MKPAIDTPARGGLGKRATRRWLLVPALAVFLGSMFWLRARLAQQDTARQTHHSVRTAASTSPADVPAPPPPKTSRAVTPVPSAPQPVVHARAEAGLAAQDDEGTVEPHPIDAERAALMPPWGAVDGVFDAIEKRDLDGARKLLEQQQAADKNREDFRGYYLGLEVMLDCLQKPGQESQARAKSFMTDVTVRASPLRRHVRRTCLDSKPAAPTQ